MDTFRQLFVFDKVQRHSVTTVTLDSYYWYRYNWKQLTQALTRTTQPNSIRLTDPNATCPTPNPNISQSQSAKWVMFSYVHKQHASSQSDVLTWEADMRKIPQIVQPVSGVWAAALYFSVFFFFVQFTLSVGQNILGLFSHLWQILHFLSFVDSLASDLVLQICLFYRPIKFGEVEWSRLTILPSSSQVLFFHSAHVS